MIIIVILLMGDVKCGVVGSVFTLFTLLLLLYPFVSLGNIFASLGSYCFAPGWKCVYSADLSVLVIL
ncbi:hypothetical protein Hanom_Chr12g01080281 [Helianthus anomalus]